MRNDCQGGPSPAVRAAFDLLKWLATAHPRALIDEIAPALRGADALPAVRELCVRGPALRRELGLDGPTLPDGLDEDEGGIPRLEARLCAFLERQGPEGRNVAEQIRIRVTGPGRLTFWSRHGVLLTVAHVLRLDVLQTRHPSDRPSLTLGHGREIGPHLARGVTVERATGRVVDRNKNAIGRIEPPLFPSVDPGMIRFLAGERGLGSVTGHRLVRALIQLAHWQWWDRLPFHNRLVFPRGWTELAELARIPSQRDRQALGDLAREGARLRIIGRREFNLWALHIDPDHGFPLTIDLGAALLPLETIKHARGDKLRFLVPVVDLPPMPGRPRDAGPIVTMQALCMNHFAAESLSLFDAGGIPLASDVWEAWAREAGAPGLNVKEIRGAWLEGDETSPPFLEQVRPNLYTLGPWHGAARACLNDLGQRRADGRRGQRIRQRRKGER